MKKLVPYLPLTLVASAHADPSLPAIFGDNMVLQQAGKVPIWGKAEPNERIDVDIAGQHRLVYAGRDGSWQVEFRNLPVGGPYVMTVKGKTTLEFKNVLVGDVWVASGQSNMEWSWNAFPATRRPNLGNADFPSVRFFQVERKASGTPMTELKGQWVVCDAETVKSFSLVSFFFARRLHQETNLPMGVVGTYWGGTPAEAWTRMSALEALDDCRTMVEHYRAVANDYEGTMAEYQRKLKEWQDKSYFRDPGNQGIEKGWAKTEFDDTTWPSTKLPANWDQSGQKELDIDGIVWFRREVNVPSDWGNRDLILELGPIDDFDVTYWNGEEVGKTGADVANSWSVPRTYTIPGRLVRAGKNVVAVRVHDWMGGGGIYAGPMRVTPEGLSSGPLNLSGDWKFNIESSRPPLPANWWNSQPQQPYGPGSAVSPSNLWNGMVHPLLPFAIKGAIWYQGESNGDRGYQYRSLFPGMIKDWRLAWGRGDFPFYFVQLANYMARKDEPGESGWAEVREAQAMTLRMKNTGMAVAIDIGEANDIHPLNKESVGERLARWALVKDYGKNVVPSGPLYKDFKIEGSRIRLSFDYADMGLATLSGQELTGFAIAGEDRKFVWAKAKIEGNTVVVWSPQVVKPAAVRYAWADNPACNLISKAGLPASPFRTDAWPGLSVDRR